MANVRINMSMDEALLAQVDAYAEAHGLTRSAFLATAAAQYIEADGKAPILRASAADLFGIISDAFRAGTSTAELEQRTAALEQQLEALK